MGKKLFLLLAVSAACITVSGQTLKKQNALLKDSIVRVNQELVIEKLTADSVSKENNVLKLQNRTLANTRDSLILENNSWADRYQRLGQKNDSLDRMVQDYDRKNQDLLLQIDAVREEMTATQARKKKSEMIWGRNKYFNLGYNAQKVEVKDEETEKMHSDFGFSLTAGRTYYLHKKPILNMIKFGIDWTYLDLTVAKYSPAYDDDEYDSYYGSNYDDYYSDEDDDEGIGSYKFELGMQFGVSVTVNPVDFLKVNAYFRYAPCFSGMYDDYEGNFYTSFGSYFVGGMAVSYKVISLGVEKYWGTSKFDSAYDDYADEYKTVDWKTSGPRIYVSFRF